MRKMIAGVVVACCSAILADANSTLPPYALGPVPDVSLPPCLPLPRAVKVDGDLAEWQGIDPFQYLPLKANLADEVSGERRDVGAIVRYGYDADALYLAIDWLSPLAPSNTSRPSDPTGWQERGDGLELHLAIDGEVVHVLSCPQPDAKASLLARRGDSSTWRDLSPEGGAAAIAITSPSKAYTQELRIPWRALSRKGQVPAGRQLRLMLDLAWQALPTSVLAKLDAPMRIRAANLTYNILTSQDRIGSRGHLASTSDWGELTFADRPAAPKMDDGPLGPGPLGLTVARTAHTPVIDGALKPGEWPAETMVDAAYAPAFIGGRYACSLGMQYDDANLYVAGHFASANPPLNTEVEAGRAGFKGGDCLQIRLARGQSATNLCAWLDSVHGSPALTADGRQADKPSLLTQGAQLKIVPAQGGYDMEMAIPWTVLFPGSKAPATGDRMRCSFQGWWSATDPRFTLSGEMPVVSRGPLALNYTMPRDAEVSLGVFNKDGALMRWLTRSDFRRAGANTEYWDGRDQDGKPLPAGDYLVKALYHDPITTEYVMTLGNPGTPPWPTTDGKGDWLSDEANPQAAATDGKWVFLAAPGSELGWSVIAVDENGQRRWGVNDQIYPRAVSLAVQGDHLYVLYSGPESTGKGRQGRALIKCLNKRTGAAADFTISKPNLRIATFPYPNRQIGLWDLRNNRAYEPGVYGGQPRYFCDNFGEATEALGLAATSSTLYVAMHTEGKLLAYDAKTGEPIPAKDIPLPSPVGLCAVSDSALLAISAGKVVRVDLSTKAAVPVVSEGLSAPHSLTVDRDGNIYVSDWKDSFQVKVFSGATGKLLRAIGKPGGRPWVGAWEKDGMLVPRGVAVTDSGRLWVAEDDECPKRVSVWNATTGELIRDYLGPTPYGGGGVFWIDPEDPTIAHDMGVRLKLDWAKGTSTPQAIDFRRMSRNQPFAISVHDIFANQVRAFKHNGRDYVGIAHHPWTYVILMRKGDIYVPVAAAGGLHRNITDDGSGWRVWDSDIGGNLIKNYYPEFFRGHKGDNYAWSDLNGDGLVQAQEMTWRPTLTRQDAYVPGKLPECYTSWGQSMDQNWSIFQSGFCRNHAAAWRLDPTGWTDAGAPIYDINKAKVLVDQQCAFDGLYANRTGLLFATGFELGRYQRLNAFPNPRPDALICFDRDGKQLWRIPSVTEQRTKDVMASNALGELDLPGIGNVIGTWQWWGNWRPYLISSDGLYVGTVLEDNKSGPASLWDESYNRYYQLPDGTPCIINGGNDGHHILKLRGLDKGGRFESPLVLSSDDVARAASALSDAATARPAEKPILSMRWLDKAPTIDGDVTEWDLGYGAAIDGGEGRSATIALGRDNDTLYLAARVRDDTPLLNKGSNWQTLFITGDCVDLMFAAGADSDPHRASAAAGDQRLLLSCFQDQPIAVLYTPVLPGASGTPEQLMAARFDRIQQLKDAKVAFRRSAGAYEIEAAVPLKTLSLPPEGRSTLRGDVGVIYSDATGNGRIKRSYYYNQRTTTLSDLTTEATLQPAEWGTILLPLGRNLLKDGGFENAFAPKATEGWLLEGPTNGMTVSRTPGAAHNGRRGLLLQQTVPVVYPPEAFKNPDYDAFARAANGGKGVGNALLRQTVPVVGGKRYSLRFYYRSEGMKVEVKDPGKLRGYSAFHAWIDWSGAKGGNTWVCNLQRDSLGWTEVRDTIFTSLEVPRPYTAPAGATSATIRLIATVNAPDILPTICVDDVEFVEMP